MDALVVVSELKREIIFKKETGEMDKLLETISKYTKSLVFDVETAKGRAEIASLAHNIRKSKSAIEAFGKGYATELKEVSNEVDGERKKMRDTLDLLRDEIRAPLTEYEDREKERIEKIRVRVERLEKMLEGCDDNKLEELRSLRAELDVIVVDDSFGEFRGEAERAYAKTSELLNVKIDSRVQYEAQQVELKKLKDAEAVRVRAAEDDKIRAEAAEKAKLKAESVAKEKAEAEAIKVEEARKKLENERLRLENEKLAAEREKIAAQEREKLEKERAEKAEADKIAADKQAVIDKAAAIAKAENEKAHAIRDEKLRVEAAASAKIRTEKEAAEKRKANEEHHKKINNAAANALFELVDIDEENCKNIVIKIALGLIPGVKISY